MCNGLPLHCIALQLLHVPSHTIHSRNAMTLTLIFLFCDATVTDAPRVLPVLLARWTMAVVWLFAAPAPNIVMIDRAGGLSGAGRGGSRQHLHHCEQLWGDTLNWLIAQTIFERWVRPSGGEQVTSWHLGSILSRDIYSTVCATRYIFIWTLYLLWSEMCSYKWDALVLSWKLPWDKLTIWHHEDMTKWLHFLQLLRHNHPSSSSPLTLASALSVVSGEAGPGTGWGTQLSHNAMPEPEPGLVIPDSAGSWPGQMTARSGRIGK